MQPEIECESTELISKGFQYRPWYLFVGQVKTAMDSFKDSIDTTLTSKAEQVASAANESAELIKKCKSHVILPFYFSRKWYSKRC